MKKVTILALSLFVAFAGTALAAEQILYLSGHAWEDDGVGGTFPPSNVGDVLNIVGILNDIEAPLVWDTANYSYTMYLRDLVSLGEVVLNNVHYASYSGGLFTIYVDFLPSDHQYTPNPPNADVPFTFQNGISTYLDGFFNSFSMSLSDISGGGFFSGDLTFTGGDVFPLLTATTGWTFGGTLAGVSPAGYDVQLNGDVHLQVVSVENESWGAIKTLYR